MKKIFAIALALVMVLSMASAFAAASMPGTCDWGTWDCTTYTSRCGVAHAEVVKFVRTNDCDPFVESDCAAVVKNERVYFGVKVVFDENVNEQWYNHADTNLDITFSKLVDKNGATVADLNNYSIQVAGKDYKAVSGKTYWFAFAGTDAGKLVEEFSDACVGEGYATSTGVKVCANVEYSNKGFDKTDIDLGKYLADTYYNETTKDGHIVLTDKATGDEAKFIIEKGIFRVIEIDGKLYNAYAGGKLYGYKTEANANDNGVNLTEAVVDGDSCSFLPAMLQFLKLNLGDCVTADGMTAFFGWDDDDAFKACVTWSKNASSIVDAECVVAIPKTGDASVLAWLF